MSATVTVAAAVVIGGGHAGVEVCAALRERGFDGRICLVSDEAEPPYLRPPLSKGFLGGEDVSPLRTADFYPSRDIELRHDPAVAIDRAAREVVLASGDRLRYGAAVLATGARARDLPFPPVPGVVTLRTAAHAAILREHLAAGPRLVIIGGGFIGLEVASAQPAAADVTIVEALDRVLARAVSPRLSTYVAAAHQRRGTEFHFGRCVVGFDSGGTGHVRSVTLDDGTVLPADLVLVGVGSIPNTELAATAGLAVDNGVTVDAYLRTSDPSVFAVGDCASFPDPRLGRRVRLESVQNAADQARRVAATITGDPAEYDALPTFYSDQGDLRLQLAGLADGGAEEVVVLGGPDAFSVCRFRDGRLAVVESVNRPVDHLAARRILAGGETVTVAEARGPDFRLNRRSRPTDRGLSVAS